MESLENTYLYHVTRKDFRHNFSPYFYMLYLTYEKNNFYELLSFVPQAVVVGLLGLRYYDDLPFCFFVQTFAFVMFNKVCTSQYFLWFLGLLPHVVTPANTGMSLKEMLLLSCLWFVAQGLWLTSAYLLEFQGMNTFIYIWLSGLLFLATNTLILTELLKHHI